MYSQLLSQRKRLLMLVVVMVAVASVSSLAMGWILYHEAIEEQSLWLKRLAKGEAALISAVADFDSTNNLLQFENATITELAEDRGRSSASVDPERSFWLGGKVKILCSF